MPGPQKNPLWERVFLVFGSWVFFVVLVTQILLLLLRKSFLKKPSKVQRGVFLREGVVEIVIFYKL
ncbi:MAG: hypothetical protein EBS74_10330 [Flavobacteriia bacterium]|nr:hypothetical protein [Flavobacteriia bacterium]